MPERAVNTLIIQDAFEPYYAGRKAVAPSFAKTRQDRLMSAKTGHDRSDAEPDHQQTATEKQTGKHDA
jgi:hypothetical protein